MMCMHMCTFTGMCVCVCVCVCSGADNIEFCGQHCWDGDSIWYTWVRSSTQRLQTRYNWETRVFESFVERNSLYRWFMTRWNVQWWMFFFKYAQYVCLTNDLCVHPYTYGSVALPTPSDRSRRARFNWEAGNSNIRCRVSIFRSPRSCLHHPFHGTLSCPDIQAAHSC